MLRWFRAAGLLGPREASELRRQWGESNEARRALDSLHQLREKLRKEILKYQAGGDVAIIAEINRLMADHPMRTRLIVTEDGFKTEAYCDAREPDDLLGPVAYSVASLFADLDRRKIRKCSNCVLHFFDTKTRQSVSLMKPPISGSTKCTRSEPTRNRTSSKSPDRTSTSIWRI